MIINYFAQTAVSTCTLNGKPIECAELAEKAKPFLGIGIAIFAILGIFLLATFVLWVVMLIHAVQHNSKDRSLWIIALVVGLLLGFYPLIAIVYFFAERKNAEQAGLHGQNQQLNQVIQPSANDRSESPTSKK